MNAKRGSRGRRAGDPLVRRSEPVRVMLRPGEADDLTAIAEGWGCELATAGWAIIADYLARLRGHSADLGSTGIAIAAAQRLQPVANPVTPRLEPEDD